MFGSGCLPFDIASAYEMSYFAFLYISIFYSGCELIEMSDMLDRKSVV